MATSKKVAKKEATELTVVSDDILFEDQGAGQEGIDSQDLMIPRITILQSMSPQVNKRDGKHVEGAEVGDIFNTDSFCCTGKAPFVLGETELRQHAIGTAKFHLEVR